MAQEEKIIGNRYIVKEEIGEGGMGVVHLVQDRLNGETVALKQVHLSDIGLASQQHPSEESFLLRELLTTEFELLASLRHPHIISVRDYGFDDQNQPYYTMSYLPQAKTLLEASVGLTKDEKLGLIQQTLQALAYLHRRGVLHRDLKPANILVVDGHVRVLDFGLAKRTSEENSGSSSGGTMSYWAPELWQHEPYTKSSDLFALGIMIYELIAGKHPFGRVDSQFFYRVLNEETNLTSLGLSQSITEIVACMLEKEPHYRYQDASEVLSDFERALGQENVEETAEIRESYLHAAEFVGREAEMSQLKKALTDIRHRKSSVWLVGGESGVGKTRLLEEVRIQALIQGLTVIQGQISASGGTPFELWREPVQHLLLQQEHVSDFQAAVLKGIIPNIDDLLGRPIETAPKLEGSQYQGRLAITIIDLLKNLPQPLVLILEDLQWAHESLIILEHISRLMNDLPGIMILGSYRSEERPDLSKLLPHIRHLTLSRLSRQNILALSEAVLGKAGTAPQIIDQIERETEGNTFFILEVIRTFAEEAGRLNKVGRAELPTEILTTPMQDLLWRRIGKVAAEDFELLKFAAIIGRDINYSLLAHLDSKQNLERWATSVANAMVIGVRNKRWSFKHDKLREAILATLDDQEQIQRHLQVAEAIEFLYPNNDTYDESLLTHWHIAGNLDKECHYLESVTTKMLDLGGDYGRAQELLTSTLSRIEKDDPRQGTIIPLLAKAHLKQGDYPEAKALATRLHQLGLAQDNDAMIANALYMLGRTTFDTGHYDEAADNLQQSLILRSALGDKKGCCEVLLQLSSVEQHRDFPLAAEYAKKAYEIANLLDDRLLISIALRSLNVCARNEGNFTDALAYAQQSLVIAQQLGDKAGISNILSSMGIIASQSGDKKQAISYFQSSLDLRRELGDRLGVCQALHNLGIASSRNLEYSQAAQHYEQSVILRHELGNLHGLGHIANSQGITAYHLGRHEQARKYYMQSIEISEKFGDLSTASLAYNNLGLIEYTEKNYTAAQQNYTKSLDLSQEIGDFDTEAFVLNNLGYLYLAQNLFEDAKNSYQAASDIREDNEHLNTAVDTWAGMAQIALKENNMAEAYTYATKLIDMWRDDLAFDQAEDKIRAFYTSWQVCKQLKLPQANDLLTAAAGYIQNVLDKNPDPTVRAIYLKQTHHRLLWKAAQQHAHTQAYKDE